MTESKKPDLELRELELKVRELELKVKDLEKPSFKRISFWTSMISVFIALVGIIGQSYLSNIKNAQAKLETDQAKKEMQEALIKKSLAVRDVKKATTELLILQKKCDTAQQNLDNVILAYNNVVKVIAYSSAKSEVNNQEIERTKSVVTKTSNNVSHILLSNASDMLLQNSILKVYYTPLTKDKAITIDHLLKSKGAKSECVIPNYDISKANNEIVYYNEPQLNYCKAVQAFLNQSGQGTFSIRLSSGANTTIQHFKIYVVK